jgi:hypothetical protein
VDIVARVSGIRTEGPAGCFWAAAESETGTVFCEVVSLPGGTVGIGFAVAGVETDSAATSPAGGVFDCRLPKSWSWAGAVGDCLALGAAVCSGGCEIAGATCATIAEACSVAAGSSVSELGDWFLGIDAPVEFATNPTECGNVRIAAGKVGSTVLLVSVAAGGAALVPSSAALFLRRGRFLAAG